MRAFDGLPSGARWTSLADVDVLDDYTGHTDPGGPAIRRTLGGLAVSKVSVGPMDNNAYLLVCTATREAVLVDAANEPERLVDLIGHGDDRPNLHTLVTTHRHPDHWQALAAVAGMFEPITVAHPLDAPELPIPTQTLVEHGDTIRVGDVELEVIHLRGHTPGSISLLYRDGNANHLFSGDCLFPGGPGKTWSASDNKMLLDDLESRVFGPLPDDTWIYPGHGDDTTLAAERPHFGEWRERGW
jgi:glyoxylase-like metal-dependent hydrolase (beta-lactamase superfamily II)